MNANSLKFIRTAGLVAGALVALSSLPLLGADKAADAFPNFDSYIKITGQAASVTGDSAAFAARARQPENGSYGIEDFYYSKETGKDVTMTINGRALTGSEDYLGSVKWSKNEVGSFEVGYKRFRTWYDGVGGFFSNNIANFYPGSNSYYPGATTTYNTKSYTPGASYMPWQPLAKQLLALDRAKFWIEGVIALPNMPVLEVKYTNELRSGKKDSTIWGQTSLTSLPTSGYLANPISPARGIIPSYIQVSERHENLEGTIRHTVKNVSFVLTAFRDTTENLDTRYVTRYPGEVKIFAVPSSVLTGKLVSSLNTNNQIKQYQTDGMATSTNGFDGKIDVTVTDTLKLKLAGAYEEVSNDVSGDRVLVTYTPTSNTVIPAGPYDPSVAAVQTNTNAGLSGTVKVKELNSSIALEWKPVPSTLVKVGVKTEKEWFHSDAAYTVIGSSQSATTGAITYTTTPRLAYARLNESGTTPVGEVRFTGIKDVALYFTASSSDVSGNENNYASYTPSTNAFSNILRQTPSQKHGDYKLGANWKVSSFLTLRAEGFQKDNKDGVVGTLQANGTATPAAIYYLLDLKYTGYKLTAIARPMDNLSFTTRYIYQQGRGTTVGTPNVQFDSLKGDDYQIGETIDFSPNKSCYLQLSGNLVYNTINTVYPRAGVYPAASATAGAYDVNRILQNSVNNYYTISALAGFAVADHTDLQLQFSNYKASNANANAGLYTVAYGVACTDTQLTVGIRHLFNDKLVMNAKVGYVDSKNDTTGGFTNYKGPMAYVSFDHAL